MIKIKSAEFKTSCVKLSACPPGEFPEIAFAGRSNVGKSSLMNRLLNRTSLVKVSQTPGKTQTLNFFLINGLFYFVDLPGYGYARVPESVKKEWQGMIEGYLSGRKQLRLVVLLLDIRREPLAQDLQMKEWLDFHHVPALVVATKSDKLSPAARDRSLEAIRNAFRMDRVFSFSSKSGEGKDYLWKELENFISGKVEA